MALSTLRLRRMRLGITQTKLAEMAGMDSSQLSKLESGKRAYKPELQMACYRLEQVLSTLEGENGYDYVPVNFSEQLRTANFLLQKLARIRRDLDDVMSEIDTVTESIQYLFEEKQS